MDGYLETDQEFRNLEKRAKKQESLALLIKVAAVIFLASIFLPSVYHTAMFKIFSSDDMISTTYTWSYDEKIWTMDLAIPKSKYEYYSSRPAPYIDPDFKEMTLSKSINTNDETIIQVADRLKILAEKGNYDRSQLAEFVLSFIQSKEYEWEMGEYIKHPFLTLTSGGDCEDSSILTASILKVLGYEVILIDAPRHIATGVHIDENGNIRYKDKMYYYMETTSPGWGLGEIPSTISSSRLEVIPLAN